ncbi:hypothetical protein V106_02698 [Staphylococcus aureus 44(2608)]|nr:hypothetical protein V106_02698 [Staphylococcus aureus 44(2608)]SCT96271.1 Uncharacterised protein [Staphylococcus aureus]SCT98561.1 Uncharacterised protein [Staphylococcus aureus]SCU12278.1 Uncharacterised protein [Staphylococcus aureus]SCU21090.1 Uncharacterised protein [Staphylococcus aureus]
MSITIILLIVLGYMIFCVLIEGYLNTNNANRASMYKWGAIITLAITLIFADAYNKTPILILFLVINFVEKLRIIQRSDKK